VLERCDTAAADQPGPDEDLMSHVGEFLDKASRETWDTRASHWARNNHEIARGAKFFENRDELNREAAPFAKAIGSE
jgi:hypothetical protein